ncbi:hypothetical protein ACJJTC_018286, partial [Scirpophaga incertulas]
NGIECHWDERRSILYLHAVTYLDTVRLAELAANLDENSKSTEKDADASHWLVASGELAADSCRTMALLFHLCHIVVLSHPTPVFDMGYLQLFKAIDAYRYMVFFFFFIKLIRSKITFLLLHQRSYRLRVFIPVRGGVHCGLPPSGGRLTANLQLISLSRFER